MPSWGREMKKVLFAILLAVAVLVAADSARAGERLAVSEQEWKEIEAIAKAAYPRNIDVELVATDKWFCVHTEVEIFSLDGRDYIKLDVYPAQAFVAIRQVGSHHRVETAEKIKAGIEAILNRPAREALK